MKNVLIIGASGKAGAATVKYLKDEDVRLTLLSRSMDSSYYIGVEANRVAGNGEDVDTLTPLVADQDVIVVVSNGDAKAQAQALLSALEKTGSKPERIFWLTGMGIFGEVPGLQGLQYKVLAKMMPTYIEAARMIADSEHPSVLMRAPQIVKDEDPRYQLIPEGQKLPSQRIAYDGIGKFVADGITGKIQLKPKESFGIVQ